MSSLRADVESTGRVLSEPLLSGDGIQDRPRNEKKHVHSRLLSLDLFRGLICMIMAWDHTTHPFTNDHDSTHSGFEAWEGPYNDYDNSPRKFISRAVSHVCAPGFFVTMGMSLIFFTASRRERLGWQWRRIFQHHLVRGCVLLLVEYIKNLPSSFPKLVDLAHGREVIDWRGNDYNKGDEGKVVYQSMVGVNEIMTALGFTMILSQLAMPLFFYVENKRKGLAEVLGVVLFVFSFAISNIAIVFGQGDAELSNPPIEFPHFPAKVHRFDEFLGRIFFYPGQMFATWEALIDPIFPWIGVAFLGMGIGFGLRRDSTWMYKKLLYASGALFVSFMFIRGFGGRMNYRGKERGELDSLDSFLRFFIQTKYPPDWAFISFTLSIDFLFIFLFSLEMFSKVESEAEEQIEDDLTAGSSEDFSAIDEQQTEEESLTTKCTNAFQGFSQRVKRACKNPFYVLLVFGRTPMFFYVAHIWLIYLFQTIFRIPDPPSGRFPLFPGVFFVWVVLIFCVYQLCARYLAFKSKTDPESIWRLF